MLKSNTCSGNLVIERASMDNIYVKASVCNIQFSNLWSYFCTILFLFNLFGNLSNVLSFYYFYFILVFTGLAILFIHCYLFRSLIIFPHCYPLIRNSLGYSKPFYNHCNPLDLGSPDGIQDTSITVASNFAPLPSVAPSSVPSLTLYFVKCVLIVCL